MATYKQWHDCVIRRTKHLYEETMIEGRDYVVCPVNNVRLKMIKRNYIENRLGMSFSEFKLKYPDAKLIADSCILLLKAKLREIDPHSGLTKHELSVKKSRVSRNNPNKDGITPNQRIGISTRKTHMSRINDRGENGYQQIARKRNENILPNGLSVQKNGLIKNAESRRRNGTKSFNKGASKVSIKCLYPITGYLEQENIKYYFDDKEYGLNTDYGYYLYDLVIPTLGMAVEFQGRAFHPCKTLNEIEWQSWRQLYSKKTANEIVYHDHTKAKQLFAKRGFRTWFVYENTANSDVEDLMSDIKSLANKDNDTVVKPNNEWEVLTPEGWADFEAIAKKGVEDVFRVVMESGEFTATASHQVFQSGLPIRLNALKVGDTIDGGSSIISIEFCGMSEVFDLVNVKSSNHSYITNGIHSKNCDELAHANPRLVEAMFTSLQPTLSTGGKAIITSTPLTDTDTFSKIWLGAKDNTDEFGNVITTNGEGKNGYFPFEAIWSDHPDRDQAWADQELAAMGEAKFKQEHCNAFISDQETLIDSLVLSTLKVKQEPAFYTGTVRWYQEPLPNHSYLVALDPSLGTGGDFSAIQVFSLPDMVQVAEWQSNKTPPRGQIRTLLQILHTIDSDLRENPEQHGDPEIFWTVENNSIGEALLVIIEDTGEDRFPGQMVNEKKKKGQTRRFRKGMTTDNRRKLSACARLKSLVESGRMTINSNNLLTELKNYVANGASYAAVRGRTDDLVASCLLIARMLDVVIEWSHGSELLRERIDDGELFDSDPEFAPMPTVV